VHWIWLPVSNWTHPANTNNSINSLIITSFSLKNSEPAELGTYIKA
jgi:hypothetical protein